MRTRKEVRKVDDGATQANEDPDESSESEKEKRLEREKLRMDAKEQVFEGEGEAK
jgi:hypothetical protein